MKMNLHLPKPIELGPIDNADTQAVRQLYYKEEDALMIMWDDAGELAAETPHQKRLFDLAVNMTAKLELNCTPADIIHIYANTKDVFPDKGQRTTDWHFDSGVTLTGYDNVPPDIAYGDYPVHSDHPWIRANIRKKMLKQLKNNPDPTSLGLDEYQLPDNQWLLFDLRCLHRTAINKTSHIIPRTLVSINFEGPIERLLPEKYRMAARNQAT